MMFQNLLAKRRMKNFWFLIYVSLLILLWKVLAGFFYHFEEKTERPNFEPSYIIFRRGNSLPLYGAIQSQNRFYELPVIKYDPDIETKAKSISQPPTTEISVLKHSLHYMIWTEICKHQIESLLYQPLFPHLPAMETITTTLELTNKDQTSGTYIFGKILPPTTGFYIFHASIKNVNFQIWISKNDDPTNATLALQNSQSTSDKVKLAKNKAYYIGIVFKNIAASGEFSLQWNIPGEKRFVRIERRFMESYKKTSSYYQKAISQNIPILHKKISLADMYTSKQNKKKYEMFKLPFIPQEDVNSLFPTCNYYPSYLIEKKLTQYAGQWETHFTSIYPEDETDMLMYHPGMKDPQVIYGNPILKKEIAENVVNEVMDAIRLKHT